jgi:glycosyltransferase involved in cell wall biosynthesis
VQHSIYVILPAYNEATVIVTTIKDLLSKEFNIVVVDDGSTDDTELLVRKLPVFYLKHLINLGQGAALQTGIDFAIKRNADFVITFDADGQHLSNDIDQMITLAEKGFDVVFGSRFLSGSITNISGPRKFFLQAARLFNFIISGIFLSDAHNGLRLFTRHAARQLNITQNGMSHATEILMQVKKNKLRYIECPVTIRYTEYSLKKGQTLLGGFKIIQDIILNKLFG